MSHINIERTCSRSIGFKCNSGNSTIVTDLSCRVNLLCKRIFHVYIGWEISICIVTSTNSLLVFLFSHEDSLNGHIA